MTPRETRSPLADRLENQYPKGGKQMKKRVLSIILPFALCLSVLPVSALEETPTYDIRVGGVQVTDANTADVLGAADGDSRTVTYDPVTNTLTLNDAHITGGGNIYAGSDLNIELVGTNSVTAPAAADSYGIYVKGNLSISGSGSLTATAGDSEDDDAFSVGICVTGDLTMNDGSVTAVGSTAKGASALSSGVYTVGSLALNGGSLTASGKEAEASENALGFSTGVYTNGELALDGGSLTAAAGIAKGAYAQSNGVFTVGDLSLYSGSLVATGGAATADAGASEAPYATSVGIFTAGAYSMWDGSVTATGAAAKGPDAYSAGIASKGDLNLHDGSLAARGGSAEGGYALSTGIEIASLTGDQYCNLNVYGGSLNAVGGAAVGITEADSTGVYAEYSGLYIHGSENSDPVVKLKGGSAAVPGSTADAAEIPYAASNGIYVDIGDVGINAGDVTITGGSWEGPDGDGWAVYVAADVEYDDDGKVAGTTGGSVTISSPGNGFVGPQVTITGVDDKNGYAIYAENGIVIGDTLTISDPAGGIIYTMERGDMILESAEEGAAPAKSATVKIIDESKNFSDVPDSHWAADAMDFVVSHGIYSDASDPDSTMTRGMLAVALWRMENEPDHNDTGSFDNVAEGSWYEDAIYWAAENGIVSGYGNSL